MKCPHCHRTGNVFQRLFTRKSKSGTRFCIFCNAEVNMIYNWKKIFILVAVLIIVLLGFNYLLQAFGWPGITGGFAGGLAGSILAVVMQRPPFLIIELASKDRSGEKSSTSKKKKRN